MGKMYDTRGTGEDAETICILKEIQEKCDEYIFLFPFNFSPLPQMQKKI